MKIGSAVVYVDTTGETHEAMVTLVEGPGPSGNKVVCVEFPGGNASNVWHQIDAADDIGYWRLPSEAPREVFGEARIAYPDRGEAKA